ncbi:type I glyceraldehyde-3-phosphate dehydrogenase [Desulfovibrio psychrotolerans]|uniref:Glyceraldehyde-3-phosphate dehydrogenase n=1 Tax=Desulfovibrio psychrotolerans TaxID=415242 RepID=A0A7J0BPR6_9BACT|nr:glyceraldehyde 3-phosphate dehydrogenase NAD-binding domain-containing protein [Desulfovibrio psychrotolerans]GFM35693.1 glyceraldehyde-3-phosphate dehydrogenase [Desulfovibrio psychrotolerans]
MPATIAINGFGRIGRYLARLLKDDPHLHVTAVNDLMSLQEAMHLLEYDSVHGRFCDVRPLPGTEQGFMLGGRPVRYGSAKPEQWDWSGCDILVEAAGPFADRESCRKHMQAGARRVVVACPAPDADATIIPGVNGHTLAAEQRVLSCASCTTNCLALPVQHIQRAFGIRSGYMTTIHPYTMRQRLLDGSHDDLRRARACGMNMLPTPTGATCTVASVLPELAGRLQGIAFRVPTASVSLIDLVCELERETCAEEVNTLLRSHADEHMGYTEEPLVSVDYKGCTWGSVVDGTLTTVTDGTMLRLVAWYDNEASFSNQLVRLLRMVARLG